MQHYDPTRCVTDTELSHELGAVRLDGLRQDANRTTSPWLRCFLGDLRQARRIDRSAGIPRIGTSGRRSLAAADLPPVPACMGLCRY